MERTRRLVTVLMSLTLLALVVLLGTPASTQAAGTADLVVTKTVSPPGASSTAQEGQPLFYTVVVTNNGPDTATGVTLTDTFQVNSGAAPGEPRNYRFLWARTTQGDCDQTDAEGVIICRLGELASGTTATVKLSIMPLEPGHTINRVWAFSEAFHDDPDLDNNQAMVVTRIWPRPSWLGHN